jgi:hypothetical protein
LLGADKSAAWGQLSARRFEQGRRLLMEVAAAGEYDDNPEQMLRMLQHRGDNSIKTSQN